MNNKTMFKMTVIFLLAATGFLFSCSNRATSFALPSTDAGFSGQIFYNNKVDILFVVDNSSSMLQYQQRLSSKVNDLIATLNSLKLDYRVAVTTTTMSKDSTTYPTTRKIIGSPTYLTSSNISLLADRLIVGESGSDLERGLDSMKYVTSESYLSSIGSDFLRSDALLSLIFISDEKDSSSEFGNPSSDDFVNYLNTRKPNFESGAKAWVANYIGILTNQSCDAWGGHVDIGLEFIRLVDASNGVKSSICSADLSSAVANIKGRIIDQLTAYRFKQEPSLESIQVTVGGRAIHQDANNGWTLETEGTGATIKYLLKFHGDAIPAADEYVDVVYTPAHAT